MVEKIYPHQLWVRLTDGSNHLLYESENEGAVGIVRNDLDMGNGKFVENVNTAHIVRYWIVTAEDNKRRQETLMGYVKRAGLVWFEKEDF